MAIVRKSLEQILTEPARVDWAKIAATTEDDIARHRQEDDAETERSSLENVVAAARAASTVTVEELSELTRIPVGDLRHWEELGTVSDAAALSLLTILRIRPAEIRSALLAAFPPRGPAAR